MSSVVARPSKMVSICANETLDGRVSHLSITCIMTSRGDKQHPIMAFATRSFITSYT